jgi:hypothetical protein
MLYQDLLVLVRETALGIVLRDFETPKHPEECFLNPPCGCSNPGKSLECEECPHLEACLSRFKINSSSPSPIKLCSSVKNKL